LGVQSGGPRCAFKKSVQALTGQKAYQKGDLTRWIVIHTGALR